MARLPAFSRRSRAAAIVATAAVLGIFTTSAAFAEPVAAVVQVSTFSPTTSYTDCGSTSIANNATSGVTLAVWAGLETSGSASVNVAVIGADGVPGPTAVYLPDASMPLAPQGQCDPVSVDAGADGGFLVTWNNGNDDSAIFGLVVTSAGAFSGGSFVVSSNTNYNDTETTSAAWSAADARYLVTWKTNVSSAFPAALATQQIVGRFIDRTGAPIGSDFLITNSVHGIDNSQDVAFGGGIWVAVGVEISTNVVQAVTIAADGTVGAQLAVPAPAGTSAGPSIAFNSTTGQFLVSSKTSAGIWGQVLTSGGALSGAPFVIAAGSGTGKPRVASLGPDGWFVSWHNSGQADVLGIQVDSSAAPVGSPAFLSSGTANTSVEENFRPEVAFSAVTGQAYAFWSRWVAVDGATNVVVRAWHVTAGIPLPAGVVAPALAATGIDQERTALVAGVGALALIAGAVILVARRRRTTA